MLITTEDTLVKFRFGDSSELNSSEWAVIPKDTPLIAVNSDKGHYEIKAWVWAGAVRATELHCTNEVLDLIKSFESRKLEAYRCPVGVPTIGWGTTRIGGRKVKMGETITAEEAEKLFRADIEEVARNLRAALKKIPVLQESLNINQFSALVSLCHNCGTAPLNPGNTIAEALHNLDFDAAADGFLLWVKGDDDETLPGLVRRREAERDVFQRPVR